MIITIDGPAGTGKTTVAKKVAEVLGFSYFDTGAMYRAITWLVLQNNISLEDSLEIQKILKNFSFIIKGFGSEKRYFIDEIDVTKEIRSQEVTSSVSAVSALLSVRKALWDIQRAFADKGDAVFEGRDMGTVVFPNAELKIFLTARPEIRAQRRLDEMNSKYPNEAKNWDHKKMLSDIMRRDEKDSNREYGPLKCPEDAFLIDTSDISIDEVVKIIIKYKMEKFLK